MRERCVACGKPIVLVNVDKMRGVIGLTQGWIHVARWRAVGAGMGWTHRAIPPEYLRPEALEKRRV